MSILKDVQWQSKSIEGLTVRYRMMGSGKKMLFLHGAWVDPLIFNELLTTLSQEYEICIPDIPPFGSSYYKSVLTFELYAAIFEELLESFEWTNVDIVGHSFGGGIGLHLAARSKRIRKAVVCNPIGIPFRRPEVIAKYPGMVYRALINLAKHNDSTVIKKLLISVGKVLLRNPVSPIARTITQCFSEDCAIFRNIHVPVTVIWGKKDEMLPLSYMEKMHKAVPNLKIVYTEGHHNWCLIDQKEAAVRIMQELL